jgi:hypothetical protein
MQLACAVVVVLLVGGATYGVYWETATLWHRHVLERSIPVLLAGTRSQRNALVGVIEAYKSKFGYYPPMYTPPGRNRGEVNPLSYELLGVQFQTNHSEFHIPVTKDPLSLEEAQKYFNSRWFSNCLTFPMIPTNFLANRALAITPMTKNGDVVGVGVTYTDFTPEGFWEDYRFSAWRYVTNPAEHNPGKFDLWVEVTVAGKHFTIGNWGETQ